jgi:hypothetical protein
MKTLAALLLGLLVLGMRSATAGDLDQLRGERVGWARLKTADEHWFRHATGDPVLMQFLRANTSLNIDPTWYAANVERLDEMCGYPLLFSQGIHVVTSTTGQRNLAEYVRRGGFLLIDACINTDINPSPDAFLRNQIAALASILPEASVVALPSTHPIYRAYFEIPGGRPPHTFMNNVYMENWARHGLYGIMIGDRLAGLITVSGLQCGWDRMIAPPGHDIACMRMLVNIYIYAMLHGG